MYMYEFEDGWIDARQLLRITITCLLYVWSEESLIEDDEELGGTTRANNLRALDRALSEEDSEDEDLLDDDEIDEEGKWIWNYSDK